MSPSSRHPELAVVRGSTYTDAMQVIGRWLLPTYQTAFRWTGNPADSQDATEWALLANTRRMRLPELVDVIDERAGNLAREAVARHWSERYGVDRGRCAAAFAVQERDVRDSPATLDSLFVGVTAEMRLVLVLRFLRRRSPADIAAQMGITTQTARRKVVVALSRVAERLGLTRSTDDPPQVEQLSAFVDDIVAGRRPVRFEVLSVAWPVLVTACRIQAEIAGNDLPAHSFVRTLERQLLASLNQVL